MASTYVFMDWKNQYCQNGYTTQSNLEIQCNPYQATNGIFQRTRTNNFTICMEIQKTSNSQSSLEKEEWNWRNQPASLQTIRQSHSHQDSMELAQRQKYRSMEQNRKSRDKSTNLWTAYLRKEARLYNRKKTTSLTSGAGKTDLLSESLQTINAGEGVEKKEPSYTVGGNAN